MKHHLFGQESVHYNVKQSAKSADQKGTVDEKNLLLEEGLPFRILCLAFKS
jgi:hypothetical protein